MWCRTIGNKMRFGSKSLTEFPKQHTHIHSFAYAFARSENRTRTFINNALNFSPWLQLIMVSSDIQLIISISYSAKTWMKRDTLCIFYIKQNADLWKFIHKAKDVCTINTYVCYRNLTYAIDCLNPETFRDIISGALIKAGELWCISVINYNNVHIMIRIWMIMMVMMMFISGPRSD